MSRKRFGNFNISGFDFIMAAMKMVLMGTGTSHGVPVVSCTCEVCRSPHKEDKRLRCSAYVENEGNSSGAWDW